MYLSHIFSLSIVNFSTQHFKFLSLYYFYYNTLCSLGGAITAALYLSEYINPVKKTEDKSTEDKIEKDSKAIVDAAIVPDSSLPSEPVEEEKEKKSKLVWFHLDFMGSKGGNAEPQGMRAVFEYIKSEYKTPEL